MKPSKDGKPAAAAVRGHCVCGAVHVEFDFPAFWAWHDHTPATRHAHGAACATYVGCWKSKVRITRGADRLTRFEHDGSIRSFCATCGTPILFERVVNLPRALFTTRTGREARYHVGIEHSPDWAYRNEPLGPVKGYPGLLRTRPGRHKLPADFP
jgi:hypothetical protein